jgi:hypothetical protein
VEWIEQEFLPTIDKQFRQCLSDPASLMAIGAATRSTPNQWLQQICKGHLTHPISISTDLEILHNYLTAARSWAKHSVDADRMGTQQAILTLIEAKPIDKLTLDEQLCFYGLLYGYLQGGGDVALALKDSLRQHTTAMTQDATKPIEGRSLCFQILSLLSPSDSKSIAKDLLQTDSAALLQAALVRLQGDDDDDLSNAIIQQFASAPPQRRPIYFFRPFAIIRSEWNRFIAALERGEYSASIVDTAQRQSLSSSLDKALWDRLQKMFGAAVSA